MESAPAPKSEGNAFETLLRIGWMVVGPAAVAVLLTTIITSGDSSWFDGRSLAIAICIVVTVAVRWWEYSRGNARTTEDEPATQAHLIRYSVSWVVVGIVAWAAANAIAGFTR